MKKELLFLGPYPTEANIKDGMISRIKAIDSFFNNKERTYLFISLRKNRKPYFYSDNLVKVYELNILFHFVLIVKLLFRHRIIYSHSIYMFSFIWYLIPFLKSKIILDVHGVVPEEQKLYNGNQKAYLYYNLLEKIVFSKAAKILCVTDSMKFYYKDKYPKFKGVFYVYSIMPFDLKEISIVDLKKNKSESSKIEVIYSGGVQPWQNIDLMMDIVLSMSSQYVSFTFLVNDVNAFNSMIEKYDLSSIDIKIASKLPSELWEDYSKVDYAFILRNKDVVNKVANPTKMIEYLNYGIIPIVLNKEIGDFFRYDYEFIFVDEFKKLKSKLTSPSVKNIEVIKKIREQNNQINILELVLN